MTLKTVMEAYDLLDDANVGGRDVVEFVRSEGLEGGTTEAVEGPKGTTDFVTFIIPGTNGKSVGGTAPTLGVIGRLGASASRPTATVRLPPCRLRRSSPACSERATGSKAT
mgnify:CR=1 FL=1